MKKNKTIKALFLVILALLCTVSFTACNNDNKIDDTVTYTITFNANGGIGTMKNQTFTEGISQNLTANEFSREGYYFLGWATSSSGTGIKYANGASFKINSDITLYAIWKENLIGLADLLAVADTLQTGSTLSFASYYTLDILDGTYH